MRNSPKKLSGKLLTLRRNMKVTRARMAELLAVKGITAASVREYETGKDEPDLIVLLRYARVAQVQMETLVDDKLRVPRPSQHPRKVM